MEDVEVFPSQVSETCPSPNWQHGNGRYHAKVWFRQTAFQSILTLWCIAAPSATKKLTTPLCSSLLASISSVKMNTLYTMLTSKAIEKQLCGPVRFHYACLLPYRWQYWHVTTMLPALRGICFMAGVRFSFDCPSCILRFICSLIRYLPLLII